MYKVFALVFFGGLLMMTSATAQENVVKDLTAIDFNEQLRATPDGVVLDLRTTSELQSGVIQGAQQLDYYDRDFKEKLKNLDRDKPYFVYCAAGARSRKAADQMKKLGFKKVFNLKDGITGWVDAELPTVPYQSH